MMLANGLVQNVAECIRRPVFLLHSGPAAAPSGAVYLGKHLGEKNLLSVDMGGTSFDVCMIEKGDIPTTTEHWENDQRVAIKMVDIASIGAGGGSIARYGCEDHRRSLRLRVRLPRGVHASLFQAVRDDAAALPQARAADWAR